MLKINILLTAAVAEAARVRRCAHVEIIIETASSSEAGCTDNPLLFEWAPPDLQGPDPLLGHLSELLISLVKSCWHSKRNVCDASVETIKDVSLEMTLVVDLVL